MIGMTGTTDRITMASDFKVLVVDDDAEARQTVVDYLLSFGMTDLYQAQDGSEAYKTLEKFDIDLIISDWEMPLVNGIEFLKAVRQNLLYKDIPFIFITSPVSQEQEKVKQAMLAQVEGYLVKPFKAETLKNKIESILIKQDSQNLRGVLIADDDDSVREVITEILTMQGFQPILQARDGEQAYRILEEKHEVIGLVISDWEMPKLEGIELLRRIRSSPVWADTPFLMITSQTSIEHIKLNLAIKAEVDHYLMKPFSVDDFKTKVAIVLKKGIKSRKIRLRIQDAKDLFLSGDFEDAKLLYHHILQYQPESVESYLGLAAIKVQERGDKGFEEASSLIRDAIKIAPQYDVAYIELSRVYEEAKSLDKAITVLKEALTQCPMSYRLHFELGRVYYKRGRLDLSQTELEKAVKMRPDYEEACELLKLVLNK